MKIQCAQEFDTRRPRIPLDGQWQFALDTNDRGLKESWFREGYALPERITVPGCAQTRPRRAARGDSSATVPSDSEVKRGTKLHHPAWYPTWYKRSFKVPADRRGQTIRLHVGGVKPSADFWLNGRRLGRTSSSRTPVRCDLTPHIRFGETNELAVRVGTARGCFDGLWDWMLNWSGLYRSVWVEAMPDVRVDGVHIVPAIRPAAAELRVRVDAAPRAARRQCRLSVSILAGRGRTYGAEAPVRWTRDGGRATLRVPMPGAKLWSPDAPNLYRARIVLLRDGVPEDEASVRFGLREVRVSGFQVLLNDHPVFLRGGCDDQHYAKSICPPADKDFYLPRLRLMKKWGFNYTKSCVEVFPKGFLEAADEVGLLVCQEMPFRLKPRRLMEISPHRVPYRNEYRRELENIIGSDRNHPCVIIYSMFSETNTTEHRAWFNFCSRELPALARKLNPAALAIDATGMATPPAQGREAVPLQTRWGRRDTDLDGYWLRWCRTCRPLTGPIPGLDPVTKPFIYHEFAWITALSEPSLVKRYAGLPCKPLNIPEMIAAARANGQGRILPDMVAASRKLKYALRKQTLELARREPKAAGYHHWLVHDFPNCAEGVFNDFWEEPHDLSAIEFRRSNDDIVLVLEHGDRWSFRRGERLPLTVLVSYFAPERADGCTLHWSVEGARRIAAGKLPARRAEPGSLTRLTLPGIVIPRSGGPERLTVRAALKSGARVLSGNEWNLWAFPDCRLVPPDGSDVIITDRLTHDDRIARLEAGARVLFMSPNPLYPPGGDLPRARCNPVDRTVPYTTGNTMLYRSVPYNTGTIGNMGTLIRRHPALGDFPHEGWCDFAWAPMIDGALPFALDGFGTRINPVIRSIGHMKTMHDKAYLFELGVGRGRLLAAALNMNGEPGGDPAADYLRFHLIRYLAGRLTRNPARISGPRLRARIREHEQQAGKPLKEIRAGLL